MYFFTSDTPVHVPQSETYLFFLALLCPVDSFCPWDTSKPLPASSWTLTVLLVELHPAFFLPISLIRGEIWNLNPGLLRTHNLSKLGIT